MALNPVTLGAAMAAAAGSIDVAGQAAWLAVANAIVLHLQANAVVVVTGVAAGVTVGIGTAAVAGTGTIT